MRYDASWAHLRHLNGCGSINYTVKRSHQMKEALKQQCVEQKPCVSEIKEDAPHVHKEHKHYSLLSCVLVSGPLSCDHLYCSLVK